MSENEKDFLVTATGADLPEFERPTYIFALPSQKLLENENIKSVIQKLAQLVQANTSKVEFVAIDQGKLKNDKNEFTCMDAREFSNVSREKLTGKNYITFAGSAFFAHPKIAAELREFGHSDLADAVAAILDVMREEGISLDIFSNHFGEDGGCGGLNFFKNEINSDFKIPNATAYKKLFEETRESIGEVAKNAKILIYQTNLNGEIIESFNLEDEEEFKKFKDKYDGNF